MMGFKEKTALMTATMFESKGVLNYILETSFIDVNQASGLDGFLHFILLLLWTLLFKERTEKHILLLLGSTQREEDSKREITVIVACIVEEDGEVIMDLEQTDEQQTPGDEVKSAGATGMDFVSKKLKKKYNITSMKLLIHGQIL
ncbi:hypothetical protein CMV_022073 [Castanea mollissima]|uniref:Uncharacterized protein n=1 Tax=Castanea mollissima TaxID=60419 RepID=A0A8J4QEI4_9ROSI|nr:hypothetical protein CMV_022073 [Castanea mollissima]